MAHTNHDACALRGLNGAHDLAEADLPELVDGQRTPKLSTLRRWINRGIDQAMDGCVLVDGAAVCAKHFSPGWLHTLDLGG